jgi:hypothetical protein
MRHRMSLQTHTFTIQLHTHTYLHCTGAREATKASEASHTACFLPLRLREDVLQLSVLHPSALRILLPRGVLTCTDVAAQSMYLCVYIYICVCMCMLQFSLLCVCVHTDTHGTCSYIILRYMHPSKPYTSLTRSESCAGTIYPSAPRI